MAAIPSCTALISLVDSNSRASLQRCATLLSETFDRPDSRHWLRARACCCISSPARRARPGPRRQCRPGGAARSNGALCVHQNAFEPVPFEGRWQQVLLLDGNIGIGGDPAKLLERLRRILIPGGRALIEVERHGVSRQMIVREHVSGRIGEPFAWTTLTLSGLDELIVGTGWRCEFVHEIDDRLVVEVERRA
jgi:hypothetical protein